MTMQINYISGPPGLGKTHFIVQEIVKRIKDKVGLTLYVAPTGDLLDQVREDIKKHITRTEARRIVKFAKLEKYSGTKVGNSVYAYLTGTANADGVVYKPYQSGSVILLTHSGFLTLARSHIPPELKSVTMLFFDEARKFVTQQSKLKGLGKRGRLVLEEIFQKQRYGKTAYHKLDLKLHNSAASSLLLERKLKPRTLTILQGLIDEVANTNLDVYVREQNNKVTPILYGVRVPSRAFNGYASVWLTSAYFEYSQMYYLLKGTPGIKLVNRTTSIDDYVSRLESISRRYEQVHLVNLTMENSLMSKEKKKRIILPKADQVRIEKALSGLGMTAEERKPLYTYLNNGTESAQITSKQSEAMKLFAEARARIYTPVQWYLQSARRVVKSWSKKHKIRGQPLLVMNNDDSGDVSGLQRISMACHGSNEYMDSNVIVYLAALRLNNSLATFLRSKFSGYDPDEDHMIDNCLQCIGRTSIRDVDNIHPVLIVLTDRHILERVSSRLATIGEINFKYARKLGDYVTYSPWDGERSEAAQARLNGERIAAYGSVDNYNAEMGRTRAKAYQAKNPELVRLMNQRVYYRRKLVSDPSDKQARAKEIELTAAIDSLRGSSK